MLSPDELQYLPLPAIDSYDEITRVWGFKAWLRTTSVRRMACIEHFYQPLGVDARAGGGWLVQYLDRFPDRNPARLTVPDPFLHCVINENGALVPASEVSGTVA